jgi:hypothetical protein
VCWCGRGLGWSTVFGEGGIRHVVTS